VEFPHGKGRFAEVSFPVFTELAYRLSGFMLLVFRSILSCLLVAISYFNSVLKEYDRKCKKPGWSRQWRDCR
jgi:hypothetical protein